MLFSEALPYLLATAATGFSCYDAHPLGMALRDVTDLACDRVHQPWPKAMFLISVIRAAHGSHGNTLRTIASPDIAEWLESRYILNGGGVRKQKSKKKYVFWFRELYDDMTRVVIPIHGSGYWIDWL